MTTAPPPGYRLVDVGDRQEEFLDVDRLAFGMASDPEVDAQVPVTLDWSRASALEDADGRLAGVHASFPFSMPVPGGSVPTAGLTWVGVRPDHRRRGLLAAMIEAHFARSTARGEPVSALFAAEATIYGRFGYGCAADELRATVDRGAALRPVAGSADLGLRLDTVDVGGHADLVHRLHTAAGRGRPGWILRETEVLRRRSLVDPPAWREGGEPLRIVTVDAGGGPGGGSGSGSARRGSTGPAADGPAAREPRGYAVFRRTDRWEDGRPRGTVAVHELAAVDAAATHRLWSFLLDLDLTATVDSPRLPVDDALLQLLVDRRAARTSLRDNLWVRLLDLPTALAARRYAAPVDVVLEVTDGRLPANAGRWRLRTIDAPGRGDAPERGTDGATGDGVAAGSAAGAAGYAACVERTADAPDVTLDVRELGAAYLGGRSLAALPAAGLATEHRPGALAAASTALAWPVAPLCSWGW